MPDLTPYRKFIVALAAALAVLGSVVGDGLTTEETITVVLAFLGSLGVYAAPNDVKIRRG